MSFESPRSRCAVGFLVVLGSVALFCAERTEDVEWEFAERLYDTELFEQASRQYRKFIRLYPMDERVEEAYFKLADCLLRVKRYSESASVLKELLQKYKEGKYKGRYRGLAYFRIGHSYFVESKYVESAEALENFVREPPLAQTEEFRPIAVYELALCYYNLKKLPEALKYFKETLRLKPEGYVERSAYIVGELELKLNLLDDAIADLVSFLKSYPKSKLAEKARLNIAHAYFRKKDYLSSAKWYRQVRGKFGGQAWVAEFQCYTQLRNYLEAIKVGESFLKSFPHHVSSREVKFSLMECYFQRKDWADCAKYASILLGKLDPERTTLALHRLCISLYYLGKFEECAKAGVAFLEASPESPLRDDINFTVAESYYRTKRWKDAVRHYSAVSEKSQFYKQSRYQVARAYDEAGMKRKSAEAYARYAEIAEWDELGRAALFRSAVLYQELRDYENAVELYKRYIGISRDKKSPTVQEAYYQRSACLLSLKRSDEMARAFRDYLKLYPQAEKRRRLIASYWIGWYLSQVKEDYKASLDYFREVAGSGGEFQMEAIYRIGEASYIVATEAGKAGRKEEAQKHHLESARAYLELARKKPELIPSPEHYVYAASVFHTQNRYREAIETYELLLRRYTSYDRVAEIYYWLGYLYQKLQPPNWQKSWDYFSKAVDFPESKFYYQSLFGRGWASWKLSKLDRALADLAEVIRKRVPGIYNLARYATGCIYYEKGEYEQAQPHLLFIGFVYRDERYSPECLYKAGKISFLQKKYNECVRTWNYLLKYFSKSSWTMKVKEEAKAIPDYTISDEGMLERKR